MKCIFSGNLCSLQRVTLNPKKVEAIKEMEPHVNKHQLMALLSMGTHISSYMPNVSDLTSNHGSLLKKDPLYKGTDKWLAFQKLKVDLVKMSAFGIWYQ